MSEKITNLIRDRATLACDIRNLSGILDAGIDPDVKIEVKVPNGSNLIRVASVPAKYLEGALREAHRELVHELRKMDRKVAELEALLED